MNLIFEFWAKSDSTADVIAMHSVPHHCLDVAAAGAALLPFFPPPVKVPAASILALIALHDVGKFSRTFQAKVPALWPESALGPITDPPPLYPHDQVGYTMLRGPLSALIAPLFGDGPAAARQPLLRALAGHHGRPPEVLPSATALPRSVACEACLEAAGAFVQSVLTLLDPPALPRLGARDRNALAWWFAGFIVVADWIGSARQWFPTVEAARNTDLTAYWRQTCEQAQRAVRKAGLIPAPVAPDKGMAALFPDRDPRPLQRWAETVALPEGPCLFVIEDATGSGKTEAALVLAHRLMCTGRAEGLFVALPTMATANAMYGRLAEAYIRLFAGASHPSLVLAHGRRALNDAFTESILDGAAADAGALTADDADAPVAAQCAAWIADNRRKSFLAQVGVGTIDQALLAVLPSRHSPLRLLGLAQRVLIVDEAHAYDAYVGAELQRLLEFHAAMGGSAIVLSATLAAQQRADLCDAFRTGLGCDHDEEPDAATAYPAATVVSLAGNETQRVDLAAGLARSVAVERIADTDSAVDAIVVAATGGGAVAWIRNTVDDAIEATELLRARGLSPVLFHARFAMGDRLAVEAEVLRLFGPASTPAERAGRVLVATQVVEQSLDVDFDLLVSDIAPADLIVQRAGRLWRHPWRDVRPVPGPRLLLLSPEPVADPPASWIGDARTRSVYDNPAVLWRSASALLSAGRIVTPDNIRALVEAAYDQTNTPPRLEAATYRAEGKEGAARGVAGQNVLKFDSPYDRAAGLWEPDDHTPTRLGEPQVTLRLASYTNDRLAPWCDDPSAFRAWCLSEVSVRASRVSGVVEDPQFTPAIAAQQARWSRWDQDTLVLVLQPVNGTAWHGLVKDRRGAPCGVTYSRATGWTWD